MSLGASVGKEDMVNELVHDLPAALDVEALSLVRDQAGYLHEAIMDVALDEGAVRLRLGQTLDEPAQASLRQALDRLIERTAKSFAKVSIKVLAEEPGACLCGHDRNRGTRLLADGRIRGH